MASQFHLTGTDQGHLSGIDNRRQVTMPDLDHQDRELRVTLTERHCTLESDIDRQGETQDIIEGDRDNSQLKQSKTDSREKTTKDRRGETPTETD